VDSIIAMNVGPRNVFFRASSQRLSGFHNPKFKEEFRRTKPMKLCARPNLHNAGNRMIE